MKGNDITMKLIGITGKSGAGKTTFSNIMAQNNDVGVIHIDDLLREIKLKYFKPIMNMDNKGEKTKVNGNLKMLLYKNKIIFNLFMKFRARLLKKRINNRVKELQELGKNLIIIDDIFIKSLHIYDSLDKLFLVERSYVERKDALKERDNLTLQDIVASDIAHYKGIYKDTHNKNKIEKILNKESRESLANRAKEIYERYHISKREKFKSELAENISNRNEEAPKIINPNKSKSIEK